MADLAWKPWKMTAVGVAVAGVTAFGTALMLGTLSPPSDPAVSAGGAPPMVARGGTTPSAADIEACRDYARTFSPERPGASDKSGSARTVRARSSDEARAVEARYSQAYQACMKGRGFGGA